MEKIKKIREATGAGILDIKKALDEADGDEKKAIEILRKKGIERADKKNTRETREGFIGVYAHSTGKIVAWVKLCCETDFVARNEIFINLSKELAMQVAAMSPTAVAPDDVDKEVILKEKEIWLSQIEKEKKPAEIVEKIIIGKEEKFRKENSLLGQAFIKDQNVVVGDYIKEHIAKLGENIRVEDFGRIEL